MEEITIGIMPKTPASKRISIIRDLRRHIDNLMEDYEKSMVDFAECWLGDERDCIEKCLGDLWKHSEMLNELIRNADPKIKEAQDQGRWSDEKKEKETSETETETSETEQEVECPECWWKWKAEDKCPECEYEF